MQKQVSLTESEINTIIQCLDHVARLGIQSPNFKTIADKLLGITE